MKLTLFGAAGEVTGSCSLLEVYGHKILVDCGAFQGGDFVEQKNLEPLGFDPAHVSAILITHSHLDHIGRLPILVAQGFKGFIYATPPTVDLTRLILEDAFHVMTYNNKKYGSPILFTETDINQTMSQFRVIEYHDELVLTLGKEQARVKFYEAGHIFGAAFIEIEAEDKRIVFSGDIGNDNVPIIRDTENLPKHIDAVVCESTYGDRLHEKNVDRRALMENVVRNAMARGGVLMIPSFSLERTQELMYVLNELIDREHRLPEGLPVFLDSPLSIRATEVFVKYPKYYDEEAKKFFQSGDDPFDFAGLKLTESTDESIKINSVPGAKIVIAGSGMMNGGRILHHAMRYLSDKRNTLFFVGFQAPQTLGRRILEGARTVEIFGQRIPVNCYIETTKALSAHGDQEKLVRWLESSGKFPKQIILNHGEENSLYEFRYKLNEAGAEAEIAEFGKTIEI